MRQTACIYRRRDRGCCTLRTFSRPVKHFHCPLGRTRCTRKYEGTRAHFTGFANVGCIATKQIWTRETTTWILINAGPIVGALRHVAETRTDAVAFETTRVERQTAGAERYSKRWREL